MNNLQKLIILRYGSVRKFAESTGRSYHPTQKNIKGVRRSLSNQKAIAEFLNLTADQAFGEESETVLPRLIRQEIAKMEQQYGDWLKDYYLGATDTLSNQSNAGND